jgi:hypothetical protein
MFSRRVPPSLAPNRFAAALAAARAAGRPLLDLTASNPTRAGLHYPAGLLGPLGDASGLAYRPEPLGLPEARQAAAAELGRRGITADAERVFLTASTSEAYSALFKLLCDAGDDVLVPRPSYPLFEHLAALDAVRVAPYDLEYHGAWSLDRAGLARQAGDRTRAVLVVTPNNPTGSLLRRDDRDWLETFCARRGLAIVSDEVFADYLLDVRPDAAPSMLGGRPPGRPWPEALTFVLGGLSKSVGLPQLKLGWAAIAGPDVLVRDALPRLELICDTYLSVSTPVQQALPRLLDDGAGVREAIRHRLRRNLEALRTAMSGCPACTLLPVEGGWSAVLRVPSVMPEEALVLRLLDQHGVVVHPGYFFDFASEAYLVVSLLPREPEFDEGIDRLCRLLADLG